MTQIVDHAHCEICMRVVSPGTRFCSPECTAKHEEALKEKKKWMWIWLAAIVATLLLWNLTRFGLI